MPDPNSAETLARLRQEAEALLRPGERLSKAERLPLYKEFIGREQ
jgi:hypothetical protein